MQDAQIDLVGPPIGIGAGLARCRVALKAACDWAFRFGSHCFLPGAEGARKGRYAAKAAATNRFFESAL
jgi:hypothetical protein